MKIMVVALALALSSCASLTPRRCADIDVAAATVEQIAAVLIAEGYEVNRAQRVAKLVKIGNMLLQQACVAQNIEGM